LSAVAAGASIDEMEDSINKLVTQNKLTDALQLANSFVSSYSSNPRSYLSRAGVKNFLGDYAGALVDVNKAGSMKPVLTEVYLVKAAIYKSQGLLSEALQDLNKALVAEPNGADIYVVRGETYIGLNQAELAMQDAKKALEIGLPEALQYGAYGVLGVAQYMQGEYPASLTSLNKAIDFQINDPRYYKFRGFTKVRLGDFAGAKKDFSSSIDLDGDQHRVWSSRAAVEAKLGENDLAIADCKKALQIDPDDDLAKRLMDILAPKPIEPLAK
jgi:tetratricopeptide (TPR) repeat protein